MKSLIIELRRIIASSHIAGVDLADQSLPSGDRNCIRSALISLLDDDDPEIRAGAGEGLLRWINEPVVAPVLRLLQDREPAVRWWIAGVLISNGGGSAIEALIKTATSDDRPDVRMIQFRERKLRWHVVVEVCLQQTQDYVLRES